jgi:hypothetical protein
MIIVAFLLCMATGLQAQPGFRFGVDVHGGYALDQNSKHGMGADLVAGYQANPYVFFGVGAGYQMNKALQYHEHTFFLPSEIESDRYDYDQYNRFRFFVRGKANFTKGKVSPFANFDAGLSTTRNMKEVKKFIGTVSQPMSGLFFEPAIGCDIQVGGAHQLFVKLGYYCQSTQYFHRRLKDDWVDASCYPTGLAGQLTLHAGFMF